jgi:hypothetical protein
VDPGHRAVGRVLLREEELANAVEDRPVPVYLDALNHVVAAVTDDDLGTGIDRCVGNLGAVVPHDL